MWFWPLVLALVILAIVGGTLAGGVFTIVLVPLAGILFISAVVYAAWGHELEGSARRPTGTAATTPAPLPHQRRRRSGREPTSPERLADARRQQQ